MFALLLLFFFFSAVDSDLPFSLSGSISIQDHTNIFPSQSNQQESALLIYERSRNSDWYVYLE